MHPPHKPDLELLARQIERDPGSHVTMELLIRSYGKDLIQFFRNRGFHDTAQDLAQETLFRVYQNIGEFRQEASVRTWLMKIATSIWKNALRHSGAIKRKADLVPFDEGPAREAEPTSQPRDIPSPEIGPRELMLEKEKIRSLRAAILALPPKMRSAVFMQYYQDLPIPQIAASLRVSETTVKSNLRDARARLKTVLSEHFGIHS